MRRKSTFVALIDAFCADLLEDAKKSAELSKKDQAETERSRKLRKDSIDVEYRVISEK